ncbi:MAG: uroporphyrinogen decarboxylase [Pseudomonadota bacterium]
MKPLLAALRGTVQPRPPVWLMRQAGRYLPEYRATRAKAGSFLDLCYSPEFAEEVTLQPIRRYGFDAAILFADILLVPHALGQPLRFVEGEGPRLDPVTSSADLSKLRPLDAIDETLSPVYETVSRLSASLPAETTLIGFAGAPWTVATYMVAGRGTPDQAPARNWMYRDPTGFGALIDLVTDATIHYLSRQIDAGAEVVKLFDSWAGSLSPDAFRRFSIEPARKIFEALKQRHPGVATIGFPRQAGAGYIAFNDAVCPDGLALDTQVSLPWARSVLAGATLQGNLDPMLMVLGGSPLKAAAERMLQEMQGTPYIVNLGHGITPDADPAHVDQLLRVVRG